METLKLFLPFLFILVLFVSASKKLTGAGLGTMIALSEEDNVKLYVIGMADF
jgi:hypothetical protein